MSMAPQEEEKIPHATSPIGPPLPKMAKRKKKGKKELSRQVGSRISVHRKNIIIISL